MAEEQEKSYYLTIIIDGRAIGLVHSNSGRKKLEQWRGMAGYETRLSTIADKKKFRRDLRKKDLEALIETEKNQ